MAVIRKLHAQVGGPEKTGLTPADLKKLHVAAASEHCASCAKERAASAMAEQQASRSTAELNTAREEAAALRRKVRMLESRAEQTPRDAAAWSAVQAGQRPRSKKQSDTVLLPVPPGRGDRQQKSSLRRTALNIAHQAEAMQDGGRHGDVLAQLRHSAEILSPVETAVLVDVLRERQLHEQADTLIHIYGRDKPDRDVLRTADQLHRQGASQDAAGLLQAALSSRQETP
jgi:hypothetical protein